MILFFSFKEKSTLNSKVQACIDSLHYDDKKHTYWVIKLLW